MKKKTSWQEKLVDNKKGLPKVERFDKKKGKNWPVGNSSQGNRKIGG
jgi:hypothetical protein